MAHQVERKSGDITAKTRIDLDGKGYVELSNNYRDHYYDGEAAYFLEVRRENVNVYVALDEQDMIELFKGFIEIAQWYKDKGLEVGIL